MSKYEDLYKELSAYSYKSDIYKRIQALPKKDRDMLGPMFDMISVMEDMLLFRLYNVDSREKRKGRKKEA